ncbi:MAG: CHAT domain-containing protein [Calothrix sp. FI2-JRJ7]|jgi:CHAT domain-containing protein/predicted negative regulator of RcsB-dependent stress response|nr:CHAT domain-containing protein [Calothrix sp. FI2-JRJ7]
MSVSTIRCLVLVLVTFLLIITISPAYSEYPSHQKSSLSLLEQGKQFYDAGKFTAGAQTWEQAVKIFQQKGEQRNQALTYNYLAIVYQDLGKWEAAQKAITTAQNLLKIVNDSLLYAQVLNTQGSFQFNRGNSEAALETWRQAENRYRSLKDVTGIISTQINQAQALQTLGLYRRAQTVLELTKQDLTDLKDSTLKISLLHSLGTIEQLMGNLQESQAVLLKALAIAQKLNSTSDIGETHFRLGNTALAMADTDTALKFYQQALNTAVNPYTRVEAELNQLSIFVGAKQTDKALLILPQIQKHVYNLPPSRATVYAQVNLAESMMKLSSIIGDKSLVTDIAQILATSVQQANSLQDSRAEAYASGELGHLYEQNKQWSDALSLTNKALSIANSIQAADITAPIYWQQGRILRAQGKLQSAITSYDQAVNILQSLRQDLVAINSNVQFSFREEVEPVYRQLVQLLLQNVDNLPETTRQQHLQRSREVIEGLQVAELENFFRQACLTYKAQPVDAIDSSSAVIYPIILDGRLEVVLSLPGKPLQHYGTNLSSQAAEKVFEELRQSLNPIFLPEEILPAAQKVYDWLLRPGIAELERQGIKTLVFVLDGFLRSLPMAVLHDGKQYIVERYNIALTPGLQLLESRALTVKKLTALAGGLVQSRQGFSALPGVEREIEQVTTEVSTKTLLNQNFTTANFEKRVEASPYSIIHLATHGQFSSKAEDTFLLTWDSRIKVKDLDQVLRGQGKSAALRLREPIELLVLSACQTAKGDNRAALGLAGVAIRSGARSTLATLWSVQDNSTSQLITEFYRNFTQGGMSKAEALRKSQLSLLNSPQYKHPYYWSGFVLVGNWR